MTEIRESRQLRDENARLRRLVAELTKHILGEVVIERQCCRGAIGNGLGAKMGVRIPAMLE
jgi:hypothetical protein